MEHKSGIRYGQRGLEYFKCSKCPERNKNSKKKGLFKVMTYLDNIELICPFCKTKYIIPLNNICYNCGTPGKTIIYEKDKNTKIKETITERI